MRYTFYTILFVFLTLVAPVATAQTYCGTARDLSSVISVNLDLPEPEFDFTRSVKYLDKNFEKIKSQYAKTEDERVWMEKGHIGGLARGGQGWAMQSSYRARQFGGYGSHYFCPEFERVVIDVFYGTHIFVASDLEEDSCQFKVTLGHEFQHHDINQTIVRRYIDRLRQDLPEMIRQVEGQGYVEHKDLPARFALMYQSLRDAIDIYMEEMSKAMYLENAALDSVENYKREGLICAGR